MSPSTSIEGRLVGRLRADSFAHITAAPLLEFDPGAGLLFGGDLTDEQIGEIWWTATSIDDDDRIKREAIAAKVAAAEVDGSASDLRYAELARYVARLGTP